MDYKGLLNTTLRKPQSQITSQQLTMITSTGRSKVLIEVSLDL